MSWYLGVVDAALGLFVMVAFGAVGAMIWAIISEIVRETSPARLIVAVLFTIVFIGGAVDWLAQVPR